MSPEGLDCYLSLNYVPAPWTLVEGIEKLLPGQWMEWRRGVVRHGALLALASRPAGALDAGDGRGGVGPAFEAIGSRTSRSRTCRWASGSAADWIRPAWCIMRRRRRARVSRRFPLLSAAAASTKRDYAREVADMYGTDHTELDLNAGTGSAGRDSRARLLLRRAERGFRRTCRCGSFRG